MPFPYPKIEIVGNCLLVGGAGSVGYLQRLLALALKDIKIGKVLIENSNLDPTLKELSKTLAELNFSLPLEHKHFNAFGFLLAGLDEEGKPALLSVGDDGSLLNIPSFYSDGSGSTLALSILDQKYSSDMDLKEAVDLTFEALKGASKLDVFTDSKPIVKCLRFYKKEWQIIDIFDEQENDKKEN